MRFAATQIQPARSVMSVSMSTASFTAVQSVAKCYCVHLRQYHFVKPLGKSIAVALSIAIVPWATPVSTTMAFTFAAVALSLKLISAHLANCPTQIPAWGRFDIAVSRITDVLKVFANSHV